MSLLDASVMAAASWNEVTPATIQGTVSSMLALYSERKHWMRERSYHRLQTESLTFGKNFGRNVSLADIASSLQDTEPEWKRLLMRKMSAIPPVTYKMALKAIESVKNVHDAAARILRPPIKALKLAMSLGNCVEQVANQTKKQSDN
ncbi:hypothetical protein RRG08_052913 [Elysia crispata]|uniref:Uncharacterized protein n=1 Tax=Elysia crispata TaxID=231223 RepID=A0AAE1D6R1_9GAST|nr:hypothetical protein RRG08_052913 [Elysia crispata]